MCSTVDIDTWISRKVRVLRVESSLKLRKIIRFSLQKRYSGPPIETVMNEFCSKLTTKTPERRQFRCSSNYLVNFEQTFSWFHNWCVLYCWYRFPFWKLIRFEGELRDTRGIFRTLSPYDIYEGASLRK